MELVEKEINEQLNRELEANEGIRRGDDGKLLMDFKVDKTDDYLELTKEELPQSNFNGHIYRFGYSFRDNISSRDRSEVIKWVKGLTLEKPTKTELRKFVNRPLAKFDRELGFARVEAIVYPDSNRSDLVQQMVEISGNYLQHDIGSVGYKLVKNLPQKVEFDWKRFDQDVIKEQNPNRYKQMKEHIDKVIENLQTKNYFSIAENILPKYRPYIKNYLIFENEEAKNTLSELQGGKILILDDINTTGSTLQEILRVVKSVNNSSEIYIFTLIGKEYLN